VNLAKGVLGVYLVIVAVGLVALVLSVLALVRGKLDWALLRNRKVAGIVAGVAVVLVVVGVVLLIPAQHPTTTALRSPGTGFPSPATAPAGSAPATTGATVTGAAPTTTSTNAAARALTCAALMSNTQPEPNHTTDLLVQTAAGATVTATAHFKAGPSAQTDKAPATGHADLTFAVGNAPLGFMVVVDITVAAHGLSKSCGTSFTPVK
jgi:hypothetical protein